MITDTELERIERLAEAATPGPWTLRKDACAMCAKEGASEWYIPQIRVGYHAPFANGDDAAYISEVYPGKTLDLISSVRELRARAEAAEAENKRLHEMTGVSVTVGGGLQVYGEMDAIRRVQDYIMLDSTHPVEKEDVRRSLVRSLQAAEAENERLRKALEPFARVAEHDIGADEDDTDTFWPMSNARYSMAGRLRVGHLRAARLALENTNG